jgi:putative phosphoribosyl transferase
MKKTRNRFSDRHEAGRLLGARLRAYADKPDVLVLGVPPGGVVVAAEVAASLRAPLDVFVVRELPVPGAGSVSMGAIAAGGVRVLNERWLAGREVALGVVDEIARREAIELARLERAYRGTCQARKMTGRTVVLIDDGFTPAARLVDSSDALRAYRPARIVVALPIVAADVLDELCRREHDVIYVELSQGADPRTAFPDDLAPVSAKEVRSLLASAAIHEEPRHRAPL